MSEAEERARARIGTTIDGKWHLDALLGIGGMAAVYAGTHRNGTRGAIKILNPEVAVSANAKSRFLREGYVANTIDHAHVVRVVDDDEAPDGTVYLVMPLLEGESLQASITREEPLSDRAVLEVARDVLDALEAAHAKGIIHRDLKPANLFRTSDGKIMLLDFGIAKVRESTAAAGIPNVTTLATLGTPGFMPPEQARGRFDTVDARADLWALGATLFALLTCRYVHEEATANEQLLAAMTKPARPLKSVLPSARDDLAALIDRALAFDREDRFKDARAMREPVDAALAARDDEPRGAASFPSVRVVVDRSFSPEAATHQTLGVAATTVATPTTADPSVSDVLPPARGTRTVPMALAAAAAVALLGGYLLVQREPNPGSRREDAAAAPATSALEANALVPPSPASAPPPAPPSAVAAVAASSGPANETPPRDGSDRAKASASVAPPAKAPAARSPSPNAAPSQNAPAIVGTSPAPAGSVDIFGKRH